LEPTEDSIDFGKKLLALRNKRGLSQSDLAKYLGIAQTTYAGYENGKRNATVSVINKFSSFFNVSPDYLLGADKKSSFTVPEHYYELNDYERDIADKIFAETVSVLYNQQNKGEKSEPQRKTDNVIDMPPRQLPLYETPASAGLGQYIDNSDYELVDVGPECPAHTNFLLHVQGDSMAPKFHDGDTLYVKQQPTVEDGEIGVFYFNGDVYVKKQEHRNGKCYLVSLNPKYNPIEIDACSECICYGKVLN
jgi:repressor LexA